MQSVWASAMLHMPPDRACQTCVCLFDASHFYTAFIFIAPTPCDWLDPNFLALGRESCIPTLYSWEWLISVNPCFIRFHHKGVYSLWKDMSPPMRCDILQFIHSGCTKTIYFRLFPGFFQLKKGQMFTRLKGQGGRGELYSLVNTLQRLNRIQGSSGRDSLFSLTFFHYGPSAETGLTFH